MDDRVRLHAIDGGYVTIDGATLPASSFRLSLQHNTIPQLDIEVDPSHPGTGIDSYDVESADFSTVVDQYRELAGRTRWRGGEKGSFEFRMRNASDTSGRGDQTLTIKDWIITDVMLGGYGFGSAMNIVIRLTHPAILLQDDSFHIVGKNGRTVWTAPRPDNILAGVVAALQFLSEEPKDTEEGTATHILNSRSALLSTAVDTYLKWDDSGGVGWPVIGVSTGSDAIGNVLHKALLDDIRGYGQTTPWALISRGLVPTWGLSIIPRYLDTQLLIGPYNPWQAATYYIADTEITSLSMPSLGGRISGVVALQGALDMVDWSAAKFPAEEAEQLKQAQGHVEQELAGTILLTNAPHYVNVGKIAADSVTTPEAKFAANSNLQFGNAEITAAAEDLAFEYKDDLISFLQRYCKQAFCQGFMQDRAISVDAPLLLQQGFLPGRTCEVTTGGDPVIKFLVTAVEHVVDCNQGIAKTRLTGAYAHSKPLVGVGAIDGGTVTNNYVYS